MAFWHRFRIVAFITISCWSTLTTNGGNVHSIQRSIDPSIVSSFVCSLVRLFTRWFVWERLFVLSFIQAFNCQATKCKQISSRSSSNNHKSLQPFSRYWSWNMQHATWKHDRDCRVPRLHQLHQVPQVDACTQNELAFKLPHWLVQWIPLFFLFYFSIWLRLPSNFFPHTFNSIKQISDRLIGSIGETTFLFCPKNWQKQQQKQKHSKRGKKNDVETAENCGKSKQQSVKTNVQRFGVSSIHFWLVLNWS